MIDVPGEFQRLGGRKRPLGRVRPLVVKLLRDVVCRSNGFALKRALSGKSNPVNYDDSVNRYMMHAGVALVVRELAGNSDNQ